MIFEKLLFHEYIQLQRYYRFYINSMKEKKWRKTKNLTDFNGNQKKQAWWPSYNVLILLAELTRQAADGRSGLQEGKPWGIQKGDCRVYRHQPSQRTSRSRAKRSNQDHSCGHWAIFSATAAKIVQRVRQVLPDSFFPKEFEKHQATNKFFNVEKYESYEVGMRKNFLFLESVPKL